MRSWLVAWCLVGTVCSGWADRKVVVHSLDAPDPAYAVTADAISRAMVAGLATLPGVRASLVRPVAEAAEAHRSLTVGEIGRRACEATGADIVVIGSLLALEDDPDMLLVSLSAYRRSGEILLLDPLRGRRSRGGSTAVFQRIVADHVKRSIAAWSLPLAEVLAVRDDGDRWLVRGRLDTNLSPSREGYALERLPPPVRSERTGETFVALPEPLGSASLMRSEDGTTWFELAGDPLVTAGERVRVVPLEALRRVETGPGLVVTSEPRGAVVTLGGQTYGVTPLWLPIPVDGELRLRLSHPDRLPYQQTIGATERAAGIVEAHLVEPPKPGVAAPPEGGVTIRIESQPPGAEVLLDGEPRGVTPLRLEDVKGRPLLTLRRPGYKAWEARLSVSGPMTIRADLESAFGGLVISSVPPGRPVIIDGQEQGVTPLSLTGVPVGRHAVKVVGEGREPETREVTVESQQTTHVTFSQPLETIATEGDSAALPRLPPAPRGFRAGPILWQRKVDLSGLDGRSRRAHLAVSRWGDGTVVSVTVGPPVAYMTKPIEGGLLISYPGLAAASPRTWTVDEVPHLDRLELQPGQGDPVGLGLYLRLPPGVVARVHKSSTLERLRVILYHPAAIER